MKTDFCGSSYDCREATVVMRATCCNWGGGRPWVLSMRRARMEEAQLESSSSKWLPMVRLEHTTTPRTRREPTRVAPDRIGSPKGSKTRSFSIDDKFPGLRGVEAKVVRSRPLLNVNY